MLKNTPQYLVSLLVILFFGAITLALLYMNRDISTTIKDVLLVLTGVLAGAFKDVVGYWLGSSHSSQTKQEAITRVLEKPATTPPGSHGSPPIND